MFARRSLALRRRLRYGEVSLPGHNFSPVIRRTRRWNVTYAHAHWVSTTKRLRKPIRQKMCRKSQTSHAKKPDSLTADRVDDGRAAADRGHDAVVA